MCCVSMLFFCPGDLFTSGNHPFLGFHSVFYSDYDVVYMEFVEDQIIFFAESPNHPDKV